MGGVRKKRSRERGPGASILRRARILAEATFEADGVVALRHDTSPRTIGYWRNQLLRCDDPELTKAYQAAVRELDRGWRHEATATLVAGLRALRSKLNAGQLNARELLELVRTLGEVRVEADALAPPMPEDEDASEVDRQGGSHPQDAAGSAARSAVH